MPGRSRRISVIIGATFLANRAAPRFMAWTPAREHELSTLSSYFGLDEPILSTAREQTRRLNRYWCGKIPANIVRETVA